MYQKEQWVCTVTGAPELTATDLITINEAAKAVGLTVKGLDRYIQIGALCAVTKPGTYTAHKRLKRWVLKTELEELRRRSAAR